MESKTPRTDAFYESRYFKSVPQDMGDMVDAREKAFARELESENAELREALAATVADLSDWLIECGTPGSLGNEKTIRVIDYARGLLAKVSA